ncbi:putative ankyrin repeat protein [Camillea tinctor]|nr:putative ankyrin repeat protein [Camillea tinctor]
MAETWWDDFSNNLATDLAPLIALFGESPTKQYLSECLTVEDIIIFAVAPLGVITAVVSAIRVCGTPSLRAFVGRAQEGAGNAEAELCSSTSRDVCELYSNGGIARVFGRPKLLEILHDPLAPYQEFFPTNGSKATAGIYSFREYMEQGRGKHEWIRGQGFSKGQEKSPEPNEQGDVQQSPARFAPNPNLSLNIGIRPHSRSWFIAAATFGFILQSFVLVWAILTRYHYQWTRNSREDEYAVPLTVIGTVLLCLGIALCAHLIESKTKEQVYQRAGGKNPKGSSEVYWVQPGNQTIGDQVFDSFAYSDVKNTLKRYITSWKDEDGESNMGLIWTAVILTTVGFISQFLGLRACHSSVAVVQLGVTILMSLVRASLRTQRLKKEDNFMWVSPEFFQGHELDFLALKIMSGKTKIATLKDTTAWGRTYLLEIQSRWVWKIFSGPKQNEASIAVSSSANTFSNSNTDERDEPNVLEPLQTSNGSPLLSGFRVNSRLAKQLLDPSVDLVDDAEKELLRWISTKYCAESETEHECGVDHYQKGLNAAVKAVFYRSRLARMTGLEEPESERSSYWGGKFVTVRNTALILAHTIEDTMQILFASDSRSPIVLHKSWEHAFCIFWTIQCSLLNPLTKTHQKDDIHMSLRREIDRNGTPQGPWKSDKSELEAVLSLWLWSLKEPHKRHNEKETNSERISQRISRILFAHQNLEDTSYETLDLDIWRKRGGVKIHKRRLKVLEKLAADANCVPGTGEDCQYNNTVSGWERTISCPQVQNAVWWRDDEEFVTSPEGPPDDSCEQRRFFGWHNVRESSSSDCFDILEITSESSLLLNCAQEIYSIFLTAILQAVRSIGGHTNTERHADGFTVTNSNVDDIRRALIRRGLCDAEDAFACIIPILKNQDKLDLPDTVVTLAGDLANHYRQERKWEKTRELTDWMIGRSYARVDSGPEQQDSATKLENTNSLRVSILAACEIYRQALLQDDDDKLRVFGCEGIIALLRCYSQDRMIMNIPAVWVDSGTVPDNSDLSNRPLTLADTIRCYGEAIMRCIDSRSSPNAREQQLRSELKEYVSEPRRTQNLFQAIRDSDLSSALYLLQRHHLDEPENTQSLFRASQLGWDMVVQALIELGAAINHEDDHKRNALSYASELGNINTARTLLRNKAISKDTDSGEWRKQGALHYAAKQGHAIIIQDILEVSSSGAVDDEDQDGITPLSWAIRSGNPDAVWVLTRNAHGNYLNHYHTRKPVLHLAIAENREDMVDVLLKVENVDPNFNHSRYINSPPLVCAVRLKYESIFEKLLSSARINADCADQENRTALWWAAALGLDSYVQKLLASRKVHSPEKSDKYGNTALSMAAELGHIGAVRQLLSVQREATVSLKVIFIAAINGHAAVVEELLPRKVKNKHHAKELLELCGLGNVWQSIQNSTAWGETREGEQTHLDYAAEIGDLSDGVLTRAFMITNAPFQIF